MASVIVESMRDTRIVLDATSFLKALGILAGMVLAWVIRDIIGLCAAALILATLLQGPVVAMARRRIPKGVTIVVAYVLLIGLTVAAATLLWPVFLHQASNLVDGVEAALRASNPTWQAVQSLLGRFGLTENTVPFLDSVQQQVADLAGGAFATLGDVLGGVGALVIVLAMAYYMLVQETEASRALDQLLPRDVSDLLFAIARRVREQVGKWFLGQLTICAFVAVVYAIGLSLIGLEAALVLAFFAGFMELVPYLGPFFAAVPIAVFALGHSPGQAAAAVVFMFIFQQFQGHFVSPAVMKRAAGLNPLLSIVALLVGAKLFGTAGALLAIPAATAANAAVGEYLRLRRASAATSSV